MVLEIVRTVVWPFWGLLTAVGTWGYVWLVGAGRFGWSDVLGLSPVLVASIVLAMIVHHFKSSGWRIGAGALILGLLLIPVFDLMLDPGCAGIESIQLYRTDEGILETRCTEMADVTTEVVAAVGGAVLVAFLVSLLVHGRRKPRP